MGFASRAHIPHMLEEVLRKYPWTCGWVLLLSTSSSQREWSGKEVRNDILTSFECDVTYRRIRNQLPTFCKTFIFTIYPTSTVYFPITPPLPLPLLLLLWKPKLISHVFKNECIIGIPHCTPSSSIICCCPTTPLSPKHINRISAF